MNTQISKTPAVQEGKKYRKLVSKVKKQLIRKIKSKNVPCLSSDKKKGKMAQVPQLKIQWLGYVAYTVPYAGIDPGIYLGGPPPTAMTDQTIEIGLRDDGVMVWRKKRG